MTILILLFILLLIFFSGMYVKQENYIWNRETNSHNFPKVSVFILNYNRPHNIIRSIPLLVQSELIDEIVISNGDPNNAIQSVANEKVIVVNDFSTNDVIGAGRRWKGVVENCSNNFIIILDDDVIPSNNLIKRMVRLLQKDENGLYGPIARKCDKTGYKTKKIKSCYNMILTPICCTHKKHIENYINSENYKIDYQYLERTKGNCEDLLFNKYCLENGIKPRYVQGKYKWLDRKNGYSDKSNHYKVRGEFCKQMNTS